MCVRVCVCVRACVYYIYIVVITKQHVSARKSPAVQGTVQYQQ